MSNTRLAPALENAVDDLSQLNHQLKHTLKYDRLAVDRQNRDRRGGHQGLLNSLAEQWGAAGTSAAENKLAKRLSHKKARRQDSRFAMEDLFHDRNDAMVDGRHWDDHNGRTEYEERVIDGWYRDWLAGFPEERAERPSRAGLFSDRDAEMGVNDLGDEPNDQRKSDLLNHASMFGDRNKSLRDLFEQEGML